MTGEVYHDCLVWTDSCGQVHEQVGEHAVVSPLVVTCVEKMGAVVESVMQSFFDITARAIRVAGHSPSAKVCPGGKYIKGGLGGKLGN